MTVVPGSLWTTGDNSTGYRVLKVLTKDKEGVHVRMYPKTLAERPTSAVDISYLEQDEVVAVSAHKQYNAGIGHLPVSWGSFWASDPVLLQFDSVEESEMEGYQIWLEAEGGYW